MIAGALRRLKQRRRLAEAEREISGRRLEGAAHGLPVPLIVSLTSYPGRFATLALTLRALMTQSVRPDRIILWLDEGDDAQLPPEVTELGAGLEIASCPDWRSYKKIVPTLLADPGACIVTADDDVYYPPDWLAQLVTAAKAGARIACHRAHRVTRLPTGRPAAYRDWMHNISRPERSGLVFLTGVSGVLYTPGVFHPDVTRHDLFTRLAPQSDDVWLYWMHRLNGVAAQKIGARARILEWEGSQGRSLRSENLRGSGNDRAIAALIDHYGWPD